MNVRSFKKSFKAKLRSTGQYLFSPILAPYNRVFLYLSIVTSLRQTRISHRVLISFSCLMSHFSSMEKQIYALFILNLFSLEIYTLKESNKIQKTLLDRTYFFFLLFFPKFFYFTGYLSNVLIYVVDILHGSQIKRRYW